MAKKKKTALKPVARGFATTSVPKKVTEPDPVEDSPPAADSDAGQAEAQGSNVVAADGAANNGTTSQAKGPLLNPEEQFFQDLIDKLQEKTEREIVRNIKMIETDRRFATTMLSVDLDPAYVAKIIELVETSSDDDLDKAFQERSDEKVLSKLGITYGTLRRLGFTEVRINECLQAIRGVSLDEGLEWLYTHCTEDELNPAKSEEDLEPKTPRTHHTPRASAHSKVKEVPPMPNISRHVSTDKVHATSPKLPSVPSASRLSATAAVFMPPLLASPPIANSADEAPLSKSLIPDLAATPPSAPTARTESPDIDDPHAEYVRLRLEIDSLTSRRGAKETRDASQLATLKQNLVKAQNHYFFRADEAEVLYRTARKAADAQALQTHLRADGGSHDTPTPPAKRRPPKLKEPVPPISVALSDATDSDGSEGGMLGILETPYEVKTSDGKIIPIRDMGAPKQWSSRTPKLLLAETVHKVDRYAVITYSNVSGHSRAKRSSVSIRGKGGKSGTWTMNEIACSNDEQAEQYISVVALHAMTYPSSEGFATGSTSSAGGGQTSFRLLAAVFRDLWDELEEKRRSEHDSINRGIWANLQSVLDAKQRDKTAEEKYANGVAPGVNRVPRSTGNRQDVPSEQIMATFATRYASPAYQDMLAQRNRLPIAQYRQEIVSALETSQVLVLSGETGCGKSTQLPAFLLEDHLSRGQHCKIYCTEPRRISAISLAQRVAAELGDPPGSAGTNASVVGYSVRLESNISKSTRLAFVTNGIALRMLEGGSSSDGEGSAFDEITHIIIDEVHERTIESDFLLIVLKSLMFQRPDLRIVLMSATVDAEKISQFFGGCPTLHVPGRTFPVDTRFLEDAVELTGWSVADGSQYARRVTDKFYRNKARSEWAEEAAAADDEDADVLQQDIKLEKRYSQTTTSTLNIYDERLIPYELIVRLLERICFEDAHYQSYSNAILIFMPGLGEIRRMNDMLLEHALFGDSGMFRILPLHSTVSSESQGAVFDVPPSGIRKIVIATNIAETGITIPDITCVIDTGKHREMRFDEKRQLSRLIETFIARSNAAQRRGRAGRVQDGLCFHLFTKVRHDTLMADHPQPEMMRLSLSDLALRIKIMKIQIGSSIEDVLSRALDPPSSVNIQRAVSALVEVRALTPNEEITPMGRLLSKLPTDVHLGKFLLISTVFRCLDPALTIAATLNSKSPFVVPFGKEDAADAAKLSFRTENSDFLTLHNVFSAWRRTSSNGNYVHKFCRQNFLSPQNLQQIEELRQQFLGYLVDASFIQVDRDFARELSRARYSRNRARFVNVPDYLNSNAANVHLVNAALVAGLYPKVLSVDAGSGQMRTISNNQLASFHPTSVNHGRKPRDLGVHHLSFFTLMQSRKMYAWETGPVDDIAMLLLCGECEFKYVADYVTLDRKIRFKMPGKTAVALKHLRQHLGSLLAVQFRGVPFTETQVLWKELAEMVLAKIKVDSESPSVGLVAH